MHGYPKHRYFMTKTHKINFNQILNELSKYAMKVNAMFEASIEGETHQAFKLILMKKMVDDHINKFLEYNIFNQKQLGYFEKIVDDFLENCTNLEYRITEREI